MEIPRTSAETLQGNLSPSAALNRKSAREYLLIFQLPIGVSTMPDQYARKCPFTRVLTQIGCVAKCLLGLSVKYV